MPVHASSDQEVLTGSMANHLTPTELARQTGMGRRDVIASCLATGVPIVAGRIDATLYAAALRERRIQAADDAGRVDQPR